MNKENVYLYMYVYYCTHWNRGTAIPIVLFSIKFLETSEKEKKILKIEIFSERAIGPQRAYWRTKRHA